MCVCVCVCVYIWQEDNNLTPFAIIEAEQSIVGCRASTLFPPEEPQGGAKGRIQRHGRVLNTADKNHTHMHTREFNKDIDFQKIKFPTILQQLAHKH